MKPIRLRLLTDFTVAGSVSRAVTPAAARALSAAPATRSTYKPGTLRRIPSYGKYEPSAPSAG